MRTVKNKKTRREYSRSDKGLPRIEGVTGEKEDVPKVYYVLSLPSTLFQYRLFSVVTFPCHSLTLFPNLLYLLRTLSFFFREDEYRYPGLEIGTYGRTLELV